MKKLLVTAFLSATLFSFSASAAPTKTYQVTGPVLEVRDDAVVVQKGKEKWEIARNADTKVKGDLKVGAKVTIEYRMTAATVETKDDAKAKDRPRTSPRPRRAQGQEVAGPRTSVPPQPAFLTIPSCVGRCAG